MPRSDLANVGTSIQEQLAAAAQTFAVEVLRILSASTLADLTSLAGQAVPAPEMPRRVGRPPAAPLPPAEAQAPAPGPLSEERRPVEPRTSALRKMAGTKPVECPVPGCSTPGIRSKMNFCHGHFSVLPEPERLKMRQAQKERHIPQPLVLKEKKGRR
jgi:hypothetical protein